MQAGATISRQSSTTRGGVVGINNGSHLFPNPCKCNGYAGLENFLESIQTGQRSRLERIPSMPVSELTRRGSVSGFHLKKLILMAIGLSDPAEGMRQPTVVICANANNDFISGF